MTVITFLRLLNKNLNLLLLCSIALAVVVFLFTRNLPKTYEARTEIYTGLASGPSVQSLGATRIDFMTTSNEFDNLIYVIKSEPTLGEVGERLLTRHLMMLQDDEIENTLNEVAYEWLNRQVPQEARDSLVVPGSELMTLRNIQKLRQDYVNSYEARILFENQSSPYSYKAISSLYVKRISNSDLIEVKYSWTDPYICQETLELLNDVFAKKLLEIKIGQSNDIVTYFRAQVEEAKLDLLNLEETLKDFRIKNKIINYDQQTRNIAGMQTQLENQYQDELKTLASAQSTVTQLEASMALNKKMLQFNDELLDKRTKLAGIKAEIAKLEVYYNDEKRLQELQEKAAVLEAELSNNLSQRFQYSKTKEGVNTSSVIQQWLKATLEVDASKARLGVLSNRTGYVEDAYAQFSPLGSELGRIERAVKIAETKYLELNHSLNMALTRQQSESISTGGIVVTVPPKLPLTALKSKQILLVLVAAVVGFLVPLMLLVVIEFLDITVRTPVRGEELTGLKLLGAYPDLDPGSEYKNVNMKWLKEKSAGHISQNLRLEARKLEVEGKKASKVLVFSTRDSEGKDLVCSVMAKELESLGKKVLVVRLKQPEVEIQDVKYDEAFYEFSNDYLKAKSIQDVLPDVKDIDSYDFVFFQIKGVIKEQYPIELVEQFDFSICVVSAKRGWNKADRFALNEFAETIRSEPRLIVNGVEPDFMDSVLGEIDKTRSGLRKFLKMVLTLQFKSEIKKEPKKSRKAKKAEKTV